MGSGRLLEPRVGGGVLAALKLGDGVNAPALAPHLADPIIAAPGTTWGDVVPCVNELGTADLPD